MMEAKVMDDKAMDVVLFEERVCADGKRLAIATLNVPATLNALSLPMVQLLTARLKQWASDPQIALVLLQASGDKAFCAGGDLQQLYQSMRAHHASATAGDCCANAYAAEFFASEYQLDYLIHRYPKPVLCWAHGVVMGGGVGLMMGASHKVVTEATRFAMPEAAIGLFPDVGGSWMLSRLPGKLGLFLALTGAQLRSADCLYAGIADYAIPHASREQLIAAILRQGWSDSAAEAGQQLSQLLHSVAMPEAVLAGPLQEATALIDRLCEGENWQHIVQKLRDHAYTDPWLQKAAASLHKAAPLSLALAWEAQRRAATMSLEQVFQMEYVLALRCAAHSDFAEGIRALLIDKDGKPQWQPADLQQLTAAQMEAQVAAMFAAPDWPQHPLKDLAQLELLEQHIEHIEHINLEEQAA